MNSRSRHTLRMLGLGLTLLLGGLLLLSIPGLSHRFDISADERGAFVVSHERTYQRPSVLDTDTAMRQIHQISLDIREGDVILSGAELWQGNSADIWLGLQFRELDAGGPAPKIFLAFRDSEGAAWLTGDAFLRDPTLPGGTSTTQEFWFHVVLDEQALRRDPRNRPEWFERVADSTIEGALLQGHRITVAGPGNEVIEGEPPLTYLYPIVDVKLFAD